jgi:hypothetical protein
MAIPGDYNGDGLVNVLDLNLVLFNWGKTAAELPPAWVNEIPATTVGINQLNGVLFTWNNRVNTAPTFTYTGPRDVTFGVNDDFVMAGDDQLSFADVDITGGDADSLQVRALVQCCNDGHQVQIRGDQTGINFLRGSPLVNINNGVASCTAEFTGTLNQINNFMSDMRISYRPGAAQPPRISFISFVFYDEGFKGVDGTKMTGFALTARTLQ